MFVCKHDRDFGLGCYEIGIEDPKEKAMKLNVELHNGSTAIVGITENMIAEVFYNRP